MWTLKAKVERPGFLVPGLCLFDDNAYVNVISWQLLQECSIWFQRQLQLLPLSGTLDTYFFVSFGWVAKSIASLVVVYQD